MFTYYCMEELTEELRRLYIGKVSPTGRVINLLLRKGFVGAARYKAENMNCIILQEYKGDFVASSDVIVEVYVDANDSHMLELININNKILTYNFSDHYYKEVKFYTGLGASVLLGPEDAGQLLKVLDIICDRSKYFEYEQRLIELRFDMSLKIETVINPLMESYGYTLFRNRQFSGSNFSVGRVKGLDLDNSCLDYIYTRLSGKQPYLGFGVHPITGKLLMIGVELNKLDKAGEAGKYVKELIGTIRKNELKDPSTMKGWRKFVAMIPVLGTPAVLSADKIMARYESSKNDVNKIIAKVKEMEVDLDSDMNSLVLMEQRAEELCEYYGVHIVALSVLYNDETEKLQKMLKEYEQDPSSHSQAELDKQREFVEKIDRHSFDLFMAGQKTHNLDLPQIRMMRQNNERLRENNEEIYRTIIPNWETSIAIAIMNQKQKATLDTQKMIKDVNNELTLNNAKMMKETTSKILVEGSRSIIDVETYKKAMNDVFTALSDTTEKLAHIKEQRDYDRAEIVKANKEISAKMLELSKRSENLLLGSTEFVPDALK